MKKKKILKEKADREEIEMLNKNKILSLEFYNYKGIFSGSMKGMRYRIEKIKKDDESANFLVSVWDEPYSYDATPKENILTKEIEFSEEGREEVVNWLNQHYKEGYSRK